LAANARREPVAIDEPSSRDLVWRAVESLPAGTLVFHVSGRVLYTNPRARSILGIRGAAPADLSIQDLFGFVPGLEPGCADEPDEGGLGARDLETGSVATDFVDTGCFEAEATVPSRRGRLALGEGRQRRTLGYKVARLGDGPGATPALGAGLDDELLVLVFQDITQLERVRAERDRFQHLASMARLFPTIAHEIKNPLAAIQGVVEIVLEGLDVEADAGRRDDLEVVLEEVARLRLLVDRMGVTDQCLQTGGERHDLVPILRKAFRLAQRRAQVLGVELKYQGPAALQFALHSDLLLMILHNLISNALEASKRGGTITVCLELRRAGTAPELALQVLDTGAGMSIEALERATEPFFTTKGGSTGIGLALIDQLVRRSRGMLTIWSRPGRGTEIGVVVPEQRP
jgi:signal transduction histidine kinase